MNTWKYALLVFLGGCSYGVLSTFVKFAYAAGYSVGEVTGSQLLIGVIIMWSAVLFTKRSKLSFSQTARMLVSGIPLGLTGVLYYQSLQTLDASLAIVFMFQFVWIGTVLEWVINKKKPGIEKIVSIIILLIGSVLAAGVINAAGTSFSWKGIALALLSAVSFAVSLYITSAVGNDLPPVQKSALLGTGGLIVVWLVFPPVFLLDVHVVTGIAPYGLILALFGFVLPPLLFSIAMPKVGSGLGTILASSELPTVSFMAAFILGEYVSGSQWFGVALILGGIIVGNVKFARSRRAQSRTSGGIVNTTAQPNGAMPK